MIFTLHCGLRDSQDSCGELMGVGDFVGGLWGWHFDFWPCGGLVEMALFTGWRTCEKHNNFAGFLIWGAVFVGFSRGWGSGCVFSRAFRGSFAFLLVSRRVPQVLDHIVLYSFPWFGLSSFAGVNYQLNIINTIFYFIK